MSGFIIFLQDLHKFIYKPGSIDRVSEAHIVVLRSPTDESFFWEGEGGRIMSWIS